VTTLERPDPAPAAPAVQLERPDNDWTRDQWGRPVILPDPRWLEDPELAPASWRTPDGGVWPDRRYTRVTTFGEALLDGSALSRWKMRRVALGMGRRPDYVTAAAALTAEERDRAALNDLAEKALEAAGPNAADIGTALHGFTERMDRGEDVGFVPPEYRADLDAYRQVIAPLTILQRECRMVCDELETAGTPDAIVLCDEPDPDGNVDLARIADLKTGNVDYTAGKFSTQLAIYAHSALYHPTTGARTYPERGLSVRWGLVIHMPAGMGTAQLRWLNLEHGWKGAQLAGPVREWRKPGSRELSRPVFLPAGVTWSADGKCQGTKRNGERCTYRATDNGYCSRHQAQARGDAPVATGDASTIADPVLETDVLEARTEDALLQQVATELERIVEQPPSTAVEPAVDSYGCPDVEHLPVDCPGDRCRHAAEPEPVTPERIRHAMGVPDPQPATAPMQLDRPDPDPADVPGGAAFGPMDLPADDPEQQAWLAARALEDDERHGELAEAGELDGDDAYPDHGPEDDAAAAMGLPSATAGTLKRCDLTELPVDQCGCARHRPDLADTAEQVMAMHGEDAGQLEDAPAVRELPPLPYRAAQVLEQFPGGDPMDPQLLQGNPRPHSGMSTPEDASASARAAEQALLQQVAACVAPTELELLYQRTWQAWTPAVRAAATAKRTELEQRPQLERTSAALWSAIRTAPTEGHLLQLWQDQSLNPLWTDAHRAAAAARQAELRQ
jgi:hypothetical protein